MWKRSLEGRILEAALQKSRAFAFGENASSAVLNFITLRVLWWRWINLDRRLQMEKWGREKYVDEWFGERDLKARMCKDVSAMKAFFVGGWIWLLLLMSVLCCFGVKFEVAEKMLAWLRLFGEIWDNGDCWDSLWSFQIACGTVVTQQVALKEDSDSP
jgi:hypothetical protein